MVDMAGKWRRRFGMVVATVFLATALGSCGCATFHERPTHSPFFASSKGKSSRHQKKSAKNPFSLFKKEEPKLAQTPGEFVGLPRPDW